MIKLSHEEASVYTNIKFEMQTLWKYLEKYADNSFRRFP